MNRRQFLKSLGITGAVVALPPGWLGNLEEDVWVPDDDARVIRPEVRQQFRGLEVLDSDGRVVGKGLGELDEGGEHFTLTLFGRGEPVEASQIRWVGPIVYPIRPNVILRDGDTLMLTVPDWTYVK